MINWKIRIRNKMFWMGLTGTIIPLVYLILDTFNIVPNITQNTVMDMVVMLISILGVLGVIHDPTTKGLRDSERALGYGENIDK